MNRASALRLHRTGDRVLRLRGCVQAAGQQHRKREFCVTVPL